MTGRHTLLIAVAAGGVAFLIATTVISCGGGNGATPTAPTSVTTRTVTNVAVRATTTSLTVGATATVMARATYSDGKSAVIAPTWASSAPGVATISAFGPIDDTGTVTAVAAGTTTITGTVGGQSGTVSITVTTPTPTPTPTVTGVSVSASATSLEVGATATVTATATYSDGTSAEVTPTWTSSAEGVATVSASGTVTAVAAGTATMTGTFGGQSDSVGITVTAITPLGTVEVLYNSGTPIAGFQFRVTGVGVTGTGGGTAAATGFTVNTGNNIVLGFSFAGATIPAGNGVLVVLEVAGSGDACLTDLVISDSSGNALGALVEDCLTISVP